MPLLYIYIFVFLPSHIFLISNKSHHHIQQEKYIFFKYLKYINLTKQQQSGYNLQRSVHLKTVFIITLLSMDWIEWKSTKIFNNNITITLLRNSLTILTQTIEILGTSLRSHVQAMAGERITLTCLIDK